MLAAAFRHRNNATDNERQSIEGNYYWEQGDRRSSIAAFQGIAERTGRPIPNHGWYLLPLRQFARAESLYRVIFAQGPVNQSLVNGMLFALMNQGKHHEADSIIRRVRAQLPGIRAYQVWDASVQCGMRNFAPCEAGFDSLRAADPAFQEPLLMMAELALMRGQLSRSEHLLVRTERLAEESRGPNVRNSRLLKSAWTDLTLRRLPQAAIARLDSIPRPVATPGLFPYGPVLYAQAGQLDSARLFIGIRDSLRGNGQSGFPMSLSKAALAEAEGRLDDAIRLYRQADRHPSQGEYPYSICTSCLFLELARVYDRAQQRDSSTFYYELFLKTPLYNPRVVEGNPWRSRLEMRWWGLVNEAWIHERLGALYEQTGDRQKAITHLEAFADLWKDADPELQPRVAAARNRIVQLKAS